MEGVSRIRRAVPVTARRARDVERAHRTAERVEKLSLIRPCPLPRRDDAHRMCALPALRTPAGRPRPPRNRFVSFSVPANSVSVHRTIRAATRIEGGV